MAEPDDINQAAQIERSQAALLRVDGLRHRADFLRAARAARAAREGFLLQARRRRDDPDGPVRVGFTCSKKVGNAVARNRAKRRLREVARLILPAYGRAGFDYVLVGRAHFTATRPFSQLRDDLIGALERVHKAQT